MKNEIKEPIIFEEKKSETSQKEELTAQQRFDEKETFILAKSQMSDEVPAVEAELEKTLNTRRKPSFFRRLFKWGFGLGGGLCVWQCLDAIYQAWVNHHYLTLGWLLVILLIATAGIGAVGRELVILKRLKNREREKTRAEELLHSHTTGNAKTFCKEIAKDAGISRENPYYDTFLHVLTANHSDQEVVALFDRMVVAHLDQKALSSIKKHTRQAAIMVAVSPLAVADILLVAWRNFSLVQEISQIYGVELSYWSRLRLFKSVLFNMAFAGISEVAIDTGLDALSMDLTAKLSSRVAQGVGVALISARLGLKTMEMMRPLPYIKDSAPKLSDIRKALLSDIGKKKS